MSLGPTITMKASSYSDKYSKPNVKQKA